MATTIIKSIGSAGRDYSTIAAWIAAIPVSLVAVDQIWQGEMYNDSNSFSGPITDIAGITTDATRYIRLTAAAGQSFQDHATKSTNAIRYNQSVGVGIEITTGYGANPFTISCAYTQVDRLQFSINYSSHVSGVRLNADNVTVKNCIIWLTSAVANTYSGVMFQANNGTCINLVVIADSSIGNAAYGFNGTGAALISCTAISTYSGNNRRAVDNGYVSPLVRNCVGFGFAEFGRPGVALAAGSDYNATDLATPGNMGPSATNALVSRVAATEWRNTGTTTYDAFPISSTTLASGLRDQTYTLDLDILGRARSITTPTRGAVEYIASAGGSAFLARMMQPLMQSIGGMY